MQLFLSLPGYPSSRSDSRGSLCELVTEEERVTHPLGTPCTFECIAPTTEPRVTRYRFRVKGATGNYILIHPPGISKVRTCSPLICIIYSGRCFYDNESESLSGVEFLSKFSRNRIRAAARVNYLWKRLSVRNILTKISVRVSLLSVLNRFIL